VVSYVCCFHPNEGDEILKPQTSERLNPLIVIPLGDDFRARKDAAETAKHCSLTNQCIASQSESAEELSFKAGPDMIGQVQPGIFFWSCVFFWMLPISWIQLGFFSGSIA
jgi:hypothetical protein